jgi:D-alanine-D-alanine ligase
MHTIGITFNLKKSHSRDDRYEEYDEIATVEALKNELEHLGFKVLLFEQNDNFFKNILKNKPDFVFNIAEGLKSGRSRESQVPCILESLNIPYSGSDPLALGVTLDKYLTNLILSSAKIPVPYMAMVDNNSAINKLSNIFASGKIFIIKPRWEGSSKGIFLNSVVNNFRDLKKQIKFILYRYRQPAVVEEFLDGEEITVGVYGNAYPRVLGMMKIDFRENSKIPFLYSLEVKRKWQEKVAYHGEESISGRVKKRIKDYALRAFRTLELRDIARIDFRVSKSNIPKIIDVNPLPGLSPHYSDLPILCRLKGKTYSDLVKIILKESFKRYGFKWKIRN